MPSVRIFFPARTVMSCSISLKRSCVNGALKDKADHISQYQPVQMINWRRYCVRNAYREKILPPVSMRTGLFQSFRIQTATPCRSSCTGRVSVIFVQSRLRGESSYQKIQAVQTAGGNLASVRAHRTQARRHRKEEMTGNALLS